MIGVYIKWRRVCTLCIATVCRALPMWNHGPSVVAKRGDNVTVSCTVLRLELLDVIRIVFTYDNVTFLPLADNGDVKLPFARLARYRVYHEHEHDAATVTVEYRGEWNSLLYNNNNNNSIIIIINYHILLYVVPAPFFNVFKNLPVLFNEVRSLVIDQTWKGTEINAVVVIFILLTLVALIMNVVLLK